MSDLIMSDRPKVDNSSDYLVISQTYWDKGLQYFNAGDSATTAIQKLYMAWAPPFVPSDLATIIGALYADTYWAANVSEGQRMSVTQLANDLSAAIGLNPADAQKAATVAFSRWYGLFVRGNTGNSGEIPKQGTLTASPDVIVNGSSSIPVNLLITNWNQTIWGPQAGIKNYAYGRAQSLNIGVAITKPTVRMYYTDAGFVPPPSSWVQVFTFDDQLSESPLVDINGGTTLKKGDRSANQLAFGVNFPGAGHYCMITAATTEFFANEPDAGQGNWNSSTWLQYNGAAGWHNLDVSKTGEANLKCYNHDDTAERFVFEAHCHKMAQGTTVSMAVEGLPGAVEEKITGNYQVIRAEIELPAGFAGDLAVKFGKLTGDASVTFHQYWVVSGKHKQHRQAAAMLGAVDAAIEGTPLQLSLGDYTFVGPDALA